MLAYRSTTLDSLRRFLDDTNRRKEEALLELNKLEDSERPILVPVLMRVFFGLVLERGGRGKGPGRRAALSSTLSSCRSDELTLLVDLMLKLFVEQDEISTAPGLSQDSSGQWSSLPPKQQIGSLTFLGEALKHLGIRIREEFPRLLSLCFDLTSDAQNTLRQDAGIETKEGLEGDADSDGNDGDATNLRVSLRQSRMIGHAGLSRIPISSVFPPVSISLPICLDFLNPSFPHAFHYSTARTRNHPQLCSSSLIYGRLAQKLLLVLRNTIRALFQAYTTA